MAINKAFLGHGIFTEYSITNALGRFKNYGGGAPATTPSDQIARFVAAMRDMEIQNVWIQIFTRNQKFDMDAASAQLRKDLIAALTNANIAWAGWGYCAGVNATRDLDWITQFKNDLGMQAFVIDAEPEAAKQKDVWTAADFKAFVSGLSQLFGVDNLALSTWPCVQLREDSVKTLMKIAEPFICLYAPQAYWMDYPGNVHYHTLGYSMTDFPPHDPVSFVRMVIRAWADAGFTKPLVISGQAYWENSSPTKAAMNQKAAAFATHFADWNQILGFNWYHAGKADNTGSDGSMSDEMIAAIIGAKLGAKPCKT
jgi:hypothetical protein